MTLRKTELASSTKPFVTRGSRVKRCELCLLPQQHCLCADKPMQGGRCAVIMLMAKGEYYKPSNTGRLIADVIAENYAFKWHRTMPQPELIALLDDPTYKPYVIFPHQYATPARRVSGVEDTKTPLFIFLDGTWREAKRMFTKSAYLQGLPVLGVQPDFHSNYRLREAAHDYQLSTAEVAIEVLKMAEENAAATALENYFTLFTERYLKGRPDRKDRG